jgi:hypothetical protein
LEHGSENWLRAVVVSPAGYWSANVVWGANWVWGGGLGGNVVGEDVDGSFVFFSAYILLSCRC